jgi:uncharacterized protein (TIGR03086 family)
MSDNTLAAQRHARHAKLFSDVAHGVSNWLDPTPVATWRAQDVVHHLCSWLPKFLATGAEIELPEWQSDDPMTSWKNQCAAIQKLFATQPDTEFTHPQVGEMPLWAALDQFYTSDVFMHTWDLAIATGQDITLDPQECRELLEGMRLMEELLRQSGHYGAQPGPLREGAGVQEQLLSLIGRDPYWRPPP